MLRKILTIAAISLVSACATDGAPQARITAITSEPAGAQVTVDGFGGCETPCTIELDAPRTVTVAKAGFLAQRFTVNPRAKRLDVKLELAAPTKDVDTTELPELKGAP